MCRLPTGPSAKRSGVWRDGRDEECEKVVVGPVQSSPSNTLLVVGVKTKLFKVSHARKVPSCRLPQASVSVPLPQSAYSLKMPSNPAKTLST
jgi:hypothetical protein